MFNMAHLEALGRSYFLALDNLRACLQRQHHKVHVSNKGGMGDSKWDIWDKSCTKNDIFVIQDANGK